MSNVTSRALYVWRQAVPETEKGNSLVSVEACQEFWARKFRWGGWLRLGMDPRRPQECCREGHGRSGRGWAVGRSRNSGQAKI